MKNLKLLVSAIILFLSVNTYGQTIVHKKKVKIQDSLIVNGNVKTTGTLNGTSASFTSNVGIGTDSAATKLHVYESSALDHVTIDGNEGDNRNLRFATENSTRWNIYATGAAETGSNAGTDLSFARYSDAGTYIDNTLSISRSSGNVGIGTSGPSAKLDVNGSAKATKFITGQLEINSASNRTNIVSDDQNLYIKSDHTSGNVRLLADAAVYVQTGSNEDLAITASSSSGVGLWHIGSKKIGTTNTGASVTGNLEVSGTVLSETNNVQTISGSTSSANIGVDKNVVVVDTTVNCTLTISTGVNVASIKIINIGTGIVYFSAGTAVTINNILDGSQLQPEFSAALTKIATNSWILSQ